MNDVLTAVGKLPESNGAQKETKHKLQIACGIAETVRKARNRAAHEAASKFEHTEVDELVYAAAQHIPVFWSEAIKP